VKVCYIPVPCLHCETAPCVEAANDNAVYRRDDGIVIIDPEKAKGQKNIVAACPYRVIHWNDDKQVPQKCTMCAHLLDEGEKMPRCVEACPTGALVFGDLDNPESEIAKMMAESDSEYLHPEFDTKPLVKYMGIPKRFISGEVILKDRQDECAQDVTVILEGDGRTLETVSDTFGDFEFNGLKADASYRVIIRKEGYVERKVKVNMKQDMNLGEVLLEPI
jgi:Fe-S-cluster-containing hydrogenase component 2